jgi:hypothetical protein
LIKFVHNNHKHFSVEISTGYLLSKTHSFVFIIFIVNIEFVLLLQVLVTNVQCKDEPMSTCTKGVVIEYQGHRIHFQRKEGDKTHEVCILIVLISIIMLDILVPWLACSLLVKRVAVRSTTVLVNFYQAVTVGFLLWLFSNNQDDGWSSKTQYL